MPDALSVLMRAIAIKADCLIAIVAQHSKAFREVVPDEPVVELDAASTYFLSVLVAATVYMVDREKFNLLFTAAVAATTIMFDNLPANLLAAIFGPRVLLIAKVRTSSKFVYLLTLSCCPSLPSKGVSPFATALFVYALASPVWRRWQWLAADFAGSFGHVGHASD